MRCACLALLLLCRVLLAGPDDPTALFETVPNAVVAGCVNVITGDFFIDEDELVVQGARPLRIPRSYASGRGIKLNGPGKYAGWRFFPHLFAYDYFTEKHGEQRHQIAVTEPNGTVLIYVRDEKNKKDYSAYRLSGEIKTTGITNTAKGAVSGRSNLGNARLSFYGNKGSFIVYGADGSERHYKHVKRKRQKFVPSEFFPTGSNSAFLLDCEHLPNQTSILYTYDKQLRLQSVRTTNKSQTKTYAKAEFRWHSGEADKNFDIVTSDGHILNYYFSKSHNYHLLTGSQTPALPAQDFGYQHKTRNLDHVGDRWGYLLCHRRIGAGRFYSIDYQKVKGKKNLIGEHYRRPYLVKAVAAPVGPNGESSITHDFSYYPDDHFTIVHNIDHVRTEYRYSDELRLEKEIRYDQEGRLYCTQMFSWALDGVMFANLAKTALLDNSNTPMATQEFIYDSHGNPLQEKLIGDLSGQGNRYEVATIKRDYITSPFNLIIKEEEPSGKVILYTYLPNTSLIASKFICDKESVKIRTFYEYSSDSLLIRETVDDGASKRMKIITLVQEGPWEGMPHIIEEKADDQLVRKTVLSYDIHGHISEKAFFDATNTYRYTLYYSYDTAGRLTRETNAIGQEALYAYDEVGNQISSTGFGGEKRVEKKYDNASRLIEEKELGIDGVIHTTRHAYDKKNRRILSIDSYENETKFVYDEFDRLIQTHKTGVQKTSYDALGRPITETDPLGNTTHKTYTARNLPSHISHPDGTEEHFIYNLDGTLKTYIDENGASTHFTYDFLGRKTSEIDPLGRTTTYIYNASNLIKIVDPAGHETVFEYDAAGRKIAESVGKSRVEIFYDALGREHIVQCGGLLKIRDYDLLDRVIEEREVSDRVLTRVAYEYDLSGRKSAIVGKESQLFDSQGRLIKKTNALGHSIAIAFDDAKQTSTETDPLGLQTITTFDRESRPIRLEKRDRQGTLLFLEETTYDLAGHPIEKIRNGDHISRWEYDARGRMTLWSENGIKEYRYTYTPTGLLLTTLKPDGILLTRLYDDAGQMISLFSSDNTVHYSFVYDEMGCTVESRDELTGRSVYRLYNDLGQLIEETLPHGFETMSVYDNMGRKTRLTLPDSSTIDYIYDELFLRSIKRGDLIHSYLDYDLDGYLLKKALANNLGTVTYEYDPLGRKISYTSLYGSQSILEYDPAGNLLTLSSNNSPQYFAYDALYRLSQETGRTYAYDAHHNRINSPVQQSGENRTYDALDRLVSVGHTQFTYDAYDRMISKATPSEITYYFYDEMKEIGTITADGHILELRVLNPSLPSERGAAVLLELNGTTYIPIHDLFGHLTTLVNLYGTIVQSYSYTAFGERRSNFWLPSFAPSSPWGYCGKRIHDDLIHFGRRFYSPWQGRWLTPDPAGDKDSYNLYLFAHNNPFTYIDLYGLDAFNPDNSLLPNPLDAARAALTEPYFGGNYNLSIEKFVQPEDSSTVISLNISREDRNYRIYFINGINNSLNEALDNTSLIVNYADGYNVRLLYNSAQGILIDLIESFLNLKGFSTEPTKLLKDDLSQYLLRNPDAFVLLVPHSQGAIIARNCLQQMPQHHRSHIEVLAVAPAAFIPSNLCASVLHITSDKDFVHKFDDVKTKATAAGTYLELKAHPGATSPDHGIGSQTYAPGIHPRILSFQRRHSNE